jgi:hypothetical protein
MRPEDVPVCTMLLGSCDDGSIAACVVNGTIQVESPSQSPVAECCGRKNVSTCRMSAALPRASTLRTPPDALRFRGSEM